MRKVLIYLVFCAAVLSCSNDKASGEPAAEEVLFFDFKIWAEEGRDEVNCLLQYKPGGPEGRAVHLPSPATIHLDGREVPADSTKFMGAYYETAFPLAGFTGEHKLVTTFGNGRKLTEEFEFQPFALAEPLPEKRAREPFVIRLSGLPETETPVRLVMIDTAFASADVNEIVAVVKGELSVTPLMLNNLVNGPIMLEIFREEERPLKEKTRTGGAISLSFSLKREFELGE